jgi:hypothetical protein
MTKPFGILTFLSCDTIAETTDGLSRNAYRELWDVMSAARPLAEQIDIENSAPSDALGLNTPAGAWGSFSDEVKAELLALAKKEEGEPW